MVEQLPGDDEFVRRPRRRWRKSPILSALVLMCLTASVLGSDTLSNDSVLVLSLVFGSLTLLFVAEALTNRS